MKGKSLEELMNDLVPADRAYVEEKTQTLLQEYLTLQQLRKARNLTQKQLSEQLKINQENVSRIEKRTDLMLSTLANYIEAMGGSLKLTVEFPDMKPVVLKGLYLDAGDVQVL
jgi:DNA-binding Xre family transcriptional regulator